MCLRCQKRSNLSPNHYFYSVWATSKSDGLEVFFLSIRQRSKNLHVPCVFLMVLVFGEQNCDSRGGFKATVNIEDATSRGGTFRSSTSTKIMKFHFDPRSRRVTKSCFWGAIWMVQHRIFITKPLDLCKKVPEQESARTNCARSLRARSWFLSLVLENIDFLVPTVREKIPTTEYSERSKADWQYFIGRVQKIA